MIASKHPTFMHRVLQCLLKYTCRTAYETAFTWLTHINDDGDTEKIAVDLQSHINIGQGIL